MDFGQGLKEKIGNKVKKMIGAQEGPRLTKFLRLIVYSYFDLEQSLSTLSTLSKQER